MYSKAEQITARADIFEQVRRLIEPLTLADRHSLIRDVLSPTLIHENKGDDVQQKQKIIRERQKRRHNLKEEQLAWYRRTEDERQQYRGQYVALYQGDVIDSDVDRQTLYRRIRQQFGRKSIPIIPAEQNELPTVTIRSPRLIPV